MSPDEVLEKLNSSRRGLSSHEVEVRQRLCGLNDIPRRNMSALSLLISQLRDLPVVALLVAAVVSLSTSGEFEAIIIVAIVVANIIVGFLQEYKSEKALQKLAVLITYKAKVLRDKLASRKSQAT